MAARARLLRKLAALAAGALVVALVCAMAPIPGPTTPKVGFELATELCPPALEPGIIPAAGTLLCLIPRVTYAQQQGARLRAKALAAGATCDPQVIAGAPILWVCFDYVSPLIARGGTTYGDTFFATSPRAQFLARTDFDAIVAHEAEHARQWRLLGTRFPQLYLEAGVNPCTNLFERTAGLAAGGYVC